MQEIILENKKNGMLFMLLFTALYLLAMLGIIVGISYSGFVLAVSIIWLVIGWIPFCGLKVLKPQEALVLTLFGKYIGTLKREGFYFVNIFSVPAVPRNQSGIKTGVPHTKISLKAMTHDNHKQKINQQQKIKKQES